MNCQIFILAIACASTLANSDLCHFDGFTYQKGDVITIQPCLAQMTCMGGESYSKLVQLGGVCPSKSKRQEKDDGQTGCLFDGRVYQTGDVIIISKCLAKMTCLGRNNYSDITQLYGICPQESQ